MRMGRIVPTVLLGAALAGVPAPASGSERTAEIDSILGRARVELADLFRLVDLSSPEIAAAQAGVSAIAGQLRQVGTYANPTIGIGIGEASVDDFKDRKQVFEIEQPLLLGNRRGPAKAALKAELRAEEERADEVRREIRGRAHTLLIDLRHARARMEALVGLAEEAGRTHDIARKRFEARAVPEAHATRALLARYELEMARDRADAQRRGAAEELLALLGGLAVPIDRLAAPTFAGVTGDTTALIDRMLSTHPGIIAAQREVEAAEATHRRARARRLPDLQLRAGVGRQIALDEEFVEAGVALDLPLFDRNQGGVEEARAGIGRAEQRALARRQQLLARLRTTVGESSVASQQLAAHRESIEPAAARGLDQARAAYRAGSLTFLELLDAQQTFAHVRIRTLELERDVERATAELARLAGLGPYQD